MQKKKYYKKLIKKKSVNRTLKFLRPSAWVANAKLSINRGFLEKRFLWKKVIDFWLPETAGGMFRQPVHRNVWVWPMLNRYEKRWLTFFCLDIVTMRWVCLPILRRLKIFSDIMKRQVVWSILYFSVFFEFLYVCCLLFIFLWIFTSFLLPTFITIITFYCSTVWFTFFFSKTVAVFFILVFICCILNRLKKNQRSQKILCKLPRWCVVHSKARPLLLANVRRINYFFRLQFYRHYYFTWLGVVCRRPLRIRYLNALRNSYFLNFFFWESKNCYPSGWKWHYNVKYDFWFDYYYNYPSFADCVHSLRDLQLYVHPFLFFRQIMTESALPSLYQSYFWRNYLQHYAKNFLIWRLGIFSNWFGYNILYNYHFLYLCFVDTLVFCFGNMFVKDLHRSLKKGHYFFDYITYFSFFFVFLLGQTNPILALLFGLFFSSLTNILAYSASRFKFFYSQQNNFFRQRFFYQAVLAKNVQFSFPNLLWKDLNYLRLYACSHSKIFIKNWTFYDRYLYFLAGDFFSFLVTQQLCRKIFFKMGADDVQILLLLLRTANVSDPQYFQLFIVRYFFFLLQFYSLFLPLFFNDLFKKLK